MRAVPVRAEAEPLAPTAAPAQPPAAPEPQGRAEPAPARTEPAPARPEPPPPYPQPWLAPPVEKSHYPLFRRKPDPDLLRIPPGATPADAAWYPLREELSEVEGFLHALDTSYLYLALLVLNARRAVYHAVGIYFHQGNADQCVEADVLVLERPYARADESENVIRAWRASGFLLVIEVRSPSNSRAELDQKKEWYAGELGIPEYLEIDPYRKVVELYRLVQGQYQRVPPDAAGRHWSQAVGGGFQMDGTGFVWLLEPDGSRVHLLHEEHAQRVAAQEEAARERQRAQRERRLALAAQREAEAAQREAEAARQEAEAARQETEAAQQETEAAQREAEAERQEAEAERQEAEAAQRETEAARQEAEAAQREAEAERQRAVAAEHRAETAEGRIAALEAQVAALLAAREGTGA